MSLALFAVSTVIGCGGAAKKQETVSAGIRDYGDGLRWQRFEQAAARLPSDVRLEFLDNLEDSEDDLRIDDYEVSRMILKKRGLAEVSIRWFWHLETKGVVHKTTTTQLWKQSGRRWHLTSETHVKGEELPGLPIWEHLEKDEPEEAI